MKIRSLTLLRTACVAMLVLLMPSCALIQPQVIPPDVHVDNVRLISADLRRQVYGVQLRVFNPNAFEVPIRDMVYELEVDGASFANGRVDPGPTLPANAETTLELTFETNMADIAQRAIGWFMRGQTSLEYRVVGVVRVARFGAPPFRFEEVGSIPLDAMRPGS